MVPKEGTENLVAVRFFIVQIYESLDGAIYSIIFSEVEPHIAS